MDPVKVWLADEKERVKVSKRFEKGRLEIETKRKSTRKQTEGRK